MSDARAARHSGIGGITSSAQDDTVYRPGPIEAEDERSKPVLIGGLPGEIAEVRAELTQLAGHVTEIAGAVAQLQGQARQLDQILPQWQHVINTLDGRVTAIGQQVARNVRLACLDAAVKARGPGDPSSVVMKLAKDFLEFVEPPAPPEPAPVFNGVDHDPAGTAH